MPDQDKGQPSLELPGLLGGRKRTPRKTKSEPDRAAAPTEPPAQPRDVEPDVEPVAEPAATLVPGSETGIETSVFQDAALDRPITTSRPVKPAKAGRPTKEPKASGPAKEPRQRKARSERSPVLGGRSAALLTGILVGAGLLGLTALGLRGCEAIQGTSSCGTAPGMAFLLVIFALAVVGGRFLLKLFKIPDPGSTSFLAVGLTSVIALLFLVGQLDTWPMLIVIPALSAGAYLLSWWVTTTYVEPSSH